MAAVMASDSQILALSTMFTEDVFAFYGGKARFGETVQVSTGRVFIIVITLVAYVIALSVPQSIFEVATQYAFAGYAALSPLLVAALFWRGSTKWGALASTLWTAIAVLAVAAIQQRHSVAAARRRRAGLVAFGADIVTRTPAGAMVLGCLPVVPMTIVSALLMVIVSRLDGGGAGQRRTRWPAISRVVRYSVVRSSFDEASLMATAQGALAGAPHAVAVAHLRRLPRSDSRSTPTSC